jgi:hypothetical protein
MIMSASPNGYAAQRPAQQRPLAADRARQLTDDQLSQAEASQRISSRSPDDGRLRRCYCSHPTRDPLG